MRILEFTLLPLTTAALCACASTPKQTVELSATVGRDLEAAIKDSCAQVQYQPLPTVTADGSQLLQLLQNLIANAMKFHSKEPPVIQISCEKKGREWIFSVADNGIGIAAEHAETIFVIFKRLHTRAEYPGSGIGLSICKKIVEHHGGRIWVESAPGHGCTFYFTLPVQAIPQETR